MSDINQKIVSLRMERQFLTGKANVQEYIALYQDLQPGQNVYWNGFGHPPILSFRAGFNDLEFNRERQMNRQLVKGRFAGGNLGWIMPEDMELFAALYRKELNQPTPEQLQILELIETMGPMTIQQMKEETGLLVKQITPILHRLQEAFLIYEDQYDGAWDRGWYRFAEMFPEMNPERYTRHEALKVILQRFAYRMVWFDIKMAKNFYKLPEKEIKQVAATLAEEGILMAVNDGYILATDVELLEQYEQKTMRSVYAMHRNDVLYKAQEPILKEMAEMLSKEIEYDHEPLQYLLIDGEFHGVVVGHFRNGPYDLNDVVCDLPEIDERKEEIFAAVGWVNGGRRPKRFMGKEL